MKLHKTLIAASLVTALGVVPFSASFAKGPKPDPDPTTKCTEVAVVVASACLAAISDTETAVNDAYDGGAFSGRRALINRDNLLQKLDESYCKLGSGKYDDAIAKMEDFKANVTAYSSPDLAKPKLTIAAATTLNASADVVITCINGL